MSWNLLEVMVMHEPRPIKTVDLMKEVGLTGNQMKAPGGGQQLHQSNIAIYPQHFDHPNG